MWSALPASNYWMNLKFQWESSQCKSKNTLRCLQDVMTQMVSASCALVGKTFLHHLSCLRLPISPQNWTVSALFALIWLCWHSSCCTAILNGEKWETPPLGGGNLTMSAYTQDTAVLSCQETLGLRGIYSTIRPTNSIPAALFHRIHHSKVGRDPLTSGLLLLKVQQLHYWRERAQFYITPINKVCNAAVRQDEMHDWVLLKCTLFVFQSLSLC